MFGLFIDNHLIIFFIWNTAVMKKKQNSNTDIMKKRRRNYAYGLLLLVKTDSWIQYNCAFDD